MASAQDAKAAKRISKLYQLNAIEVKDETEEKMEASFNNLQIKLKDLSEKESHDAIVALANLNYEDVTGGFLFGILTEPQQASRYYRDLTLVTRDGMCMFVTKLNFILMERYNKLLEIPRQQIIWFVREAIKNNVQYMDNVCLNLLRAIVGGDVTPKNVWLADNLLSIFIEFRAWLEKFLFLLSNAVYCYLRLIADHTSPGLENLRAKEIKFCITLLREKMIDILNFGGREISRALLAVCRIPEFEKLWSDMTNNPSTISPQFTGIWQLLSARCQKRATLYRLTVELERKIFFLLTQVRTPSQAKYLEWLQRQFLSTPESATLRSDIIRYVCCMVHPSNEVLASDIVPRWQFILWLLSTCTNVAETQLCRTALFYDYLFFDPEKESIMNIEPAVLLLFNCSKTQPSLFLSLMDFLTRITVNFCPNVADQIKSCVVTSFKTLTEKKVVASLSPLFDSPKIDGDLKSIIREVFDDFCSPKDKDEELPTPLAESSSVEMDFDDIPLLSIDDDDNNTNDDIDDSRVVQNSIEDNQDSSLVIDNGNEEEIDLPKKKERRTSQLTMWESEGDLINPFDNPEPADIAPSLDNLHTTLRSLVEDMQKLLSDDEYDRGERLYKVVLQVFRLQDEFDEDQATALAECLCGLFRPFFARKVYPENIENESDLEESIRAPIFCIFRNMCLTPDDDSDSQRQLLMLISEMYLKQQRIGYLLLYFLKASQDIGEKWNVYKDMCEMLDEDLSVMLLKDMKLCQEDDYKLFLYLVPEIYRKLSTVALQSAELMHLIVSTVDAVQLQELICEIVQGNLTFFRKEDSSLKWETIEQFFFWQFVNAEEVPLDWVVPIIQKITFPVFSKDAVHQAMYDVKRQASESLKTKYSELFAMMEILDSVRDGRNLRRGRKVTPASAIGHQQHQSANAGDSSDDEHSGKSPMKQQAKKRRKVVESESD